MVDYNGGYQVFANRTRTKTFFRATDRYTKTVTVKAGQVLKAHSFLESDADGKVIAHSGFTEATLVTFAAITSGQTQILAGLTFTSGASGTTAAQLATAWGVINTGDTAAAATTKIAAAGITAAMGTFTAGTLAGWETEPFAATKVQFRSTAPGTNPTDLADTGTATDPTFAVVQGETALNKIAGVLAFDVDATSADVDASAYTKASFWADALVWAVDPTVDTITKFDGTTVAVTAYNTGCYGTSPEAIRLQKKFVEQTGFEPLGYVSAGETL